MTYLSRLLGSQAEDDSQLLVVSLNLRGEAALTANNLLSVNPASTISAFRVQVLGFRDLQVCDNKLNEGVNATSQQGAKHTMPEPKQAATSFETPPQHTHKTTTQQQQGSAAEQGATCRLSFPKPV
jgi:hypothetical protein